MIFYSPFPFGICLLEIWGMDFGLGLGLGLVNIGKILTKVGMLV